MSPGEAERRRRWVGAGLATAVAVVLAASAGGAALLGAAGGGAGPEAVEDPGRETVGDPGPMDWRFGVGERLVYRVTFGRVKVGEGTLSVAGVDTVRGTPTYRLRFTLQGGPFFYKVDDEQHSWVAPAPLRSLRFEQRLREGDYRRDHRYELDQESSTYSLLTWDEEREEWTPEEDRTDISMPEHALDEIAYLYLARLLPLEVGKTYRFERYFEEDGNPVILKVLRREEVRVPAGSFQTVVVRPIIQTDGLFSEGGEAEVYISDDEERRIVQLKSRMKVGSLSMYLKSYEPGRPAELFTPDASRNR